MNQGPRKFTQSKCTARAGACHTHKDRAQSIGIREERGGGRATHNLSWIFKKKKNKKKILGFAQINLEYSDRSSVVQQENVTSSPSTAKWTINQFCQLMTVCYLWIKSYFLYKIRVCFQTRTGLVLHGQTLNSQVAWWKVCSVADATESIIFWVPQTETHSQGAWMLFSIWCSRKLQTVHKDSKRAVDHFIITHPATHESLHMLSSLWNCVTMREGNIFRVFYIQQRKKIGELKFNLSHQ